MTLKPKPLALKKQINQHQKLKRKYNQIKTKKQIENQKKELEEKNQTSGIYILFNLLEKQQNDQKERIFELEERIIKLEG